MNSESDVSPIDLQTVWNAIPGNYVIILPNAPTFTVIGATDAFIDTSYNKRDNIIGRSLFDIFPDNPANEQATGASNLRASLEYVIRHKKVHRMAYQGYDIINPDTGAFEFRVWTASNTPVFSAEGGIQYILHSTEDITEKVKLDEENIQREERLVESERRFRNLVRDATAAIVVLTGPEMKIKVINEACGRLIERTPDELLGKPLFSVIPEAASYYLPVLERVRQTEEPVTLYESPYSVKKDGKTIEGFLHVVYQPYRNSAGSTEGVMAILQDVTASVKAKKALEESEAKYRSLFETIDQGFCIIEVLFDENTRPIDYLFLETNPAFEKQTGLVDAIGKTARELVPNLEEHWFQLYGDVVRTGKSVRFIEGSDALSRWFEVDAFHIGAEGSKTVAILFTDITKRREVENELLKSETYFRELTDTVPAIIWITRTDGYCTYLNKNWYKFTGQSEGEAEGFGWLDATHPDDKKEAARLFLEATEKQAPYYMLYRLRHKSGEYRWAIDSGQPKFSLDGTFEGMIGTVIDVHEQKLAENKIRESEKRFRSMADASPVMIWTLDEKGNSTYYNRMAREFTGDTEEDLANGKTWQIAIHPDDIAFAAGEVNNAVTERIPYQMECRMQRADGEWRWLLNQGIPRFGSKGEYFGFVGSSIDITEQKNSQLSLETALEQIRLSKEAAELGTFDLNLEKGTMHWDDRCRTLFGISHHGTVTYERDFAGGLHPDDRERVLRLIDRLFVKSISNGDYDVEYRTVGAEDGVVRWVRAKGKVYFNEQEKPVRFIGSVLDITEKAMAMQQIEAVVEERTKELAKTNQELERINKELQRSNQNLEEFAYAASHDLKEPVRKIHFFTNQLKGQLSTHLAEAEIRSFNRIENATQRMGNLIDDLLLYSHVSHRPHEMESVDLNIQVKNAMEDLELDIEEKKAMIQIDELPIVQGYGRQLQQLFQNLISNGLKYSKEDVPPRIKVAHREVAKANQHYHLISVEDNGIGFPQEYGEKIFQMFTRLHGKAEYSGTGVGLSIVKKVVENHNGFIEVESVVNDGSVFKMYLPKQL